MTVASDHIATADLARHLTGLGYENLFMRLDSANLDRIWSAHDAPEQLRHLVLQSGADPSARFLAAEVLAARAPEFPPDDLKSPLAQIYARALETAEIANPWGLPGEVGPVGQHLLQIGVAAVQPFVELLDDRRRVAYIGSKDATFGNSYAYRVKDLAAFYLSLLSDLPYRVLERPADRDPEIKSLRNQVELRWRGGAA
jgi:hypothetical protein